MITGLITIVLTLLILKGTEILLNSKISSTPKNKKNTNVVSEKVETVANHANNNNTHEDTPIKHHYKPSDFQLELQQNSQSPEQLDSKMMMQETEKISKIAKSDCAYIKSQLLLKAKSGQYELLNEQRYITYDYISEYLKGQIRRTDQTMRIKKIFGVGNHIFGNVEYKIKDMKLYELYLQTISDIASLDHIFITPVFFAECLTKTKKVDLPYIYTGEYNLSHQVKAYLRCSVFY